MSEFEFTEDEKAILSEVYQNGSDDYSFYPHLGGDDYAVLRSLKERGFVEAYGDYGEVRLTSKELNDWVYQNIVQPERIERGW